MLEGWIRKEGLSLSSCAVPLIRVHASIFGMKSGGHPTKFSWTSGVRQLWWKPSRLLERCGKVQTWYPDCGNLSRNISGAQELNLDICLEIGRLHRTSPEVWKELKTSLGRIPSRNQQRKGCSGLCPKQKGKGWGVRDWTRGCMTRVKPMSGNGRDKQRIGTKALSQSLDRGDKDVQRNTKWRMSIWTQSRIVTDEWRTDKSYPDEVWNSQG
jgi:hypothetical protein